MFVQSGGCCDGSDPMCFAAGEFHIGDGDLLLGTVDGCPYYIDSGLYQTLGSPRLLLDAEPGTPGGFSLAAGDGLHFTVRILAPADNERALSRSEPSAEPTFIENRRETP